MSWVIVLLIVLACIAGFFLAPKGWRTRLVNLISGVPALLALLIDQLQMMDLSQYLPPEKALGLMVFINVFNIVLRQVTTTPPGRSDETIDWA